MTVSFSTLDLNLLRVFDAIMEERSVLRASQRVFLSQSAVSHSLARLREMLDDELFVRTAAGMQPTARALAMAPLVRDALKTLEAAVGPPKFDPGSSTKKFTIAANDFTTTIVAPHLLGILGAEAPHIDIVIRPVTRIDLAEQIDLGRIDAAIGTFSPAPQRFKSSLLFEYDDVLIAPASRSLGTMTIEKLSRLSIVVVSFGGEQEGAVDGFISERGLARRSEMYDRSAFERAFSAAERVPRIAVSLPHFLAVPALLEGPDLVAIVPRPLAEAFAREHAISICELPYPTTRLEVRSLWHERHEGDASQEWLHGILRRATAHLRTGSVKGGPT
ncbi:LysR family transcriptional regulator [Bradyrhizobium lablabi]|uniref:LysR family transcriptional regulator n=1 Tax=Bradyrhizobium lablabi TaxID=722472 RepID=UPI001BA79CA8|nr:LysR family transcriptional regulator [Bradyrhizobium lablabi]MBR1124610.1 LysR family transcriptional regulator [Bradyrhizobium lablabi]